MSKELLTMSAHALKSAYQSGALSPVEVCTTLLNHIERHDDALNAWCLIDRANRPRSKSPAAPQDVR